MTYDEWDELSKDMAEEAWCIGVGTVMMIPYKDVKAGIHAIRRQSEDNIDQLSEKVQDFRRLEGHMKNALIALEKFGYKIVKEKP